MMTTPVAIERWHAVVASGDLGLLDGLIADEAVFRSPIVFTPQRGKAKTIFYLTGAYHVLMPGGFHYVREIIGPDDAALEFKATLEGIEVHGADFVHWNAAGQIDDFMVMIRPLKAINLMHRLMMAQLEALG